MIPVEQGDLGLSGCPKPIVKGRYWQCVKNCPFLRCDSVAMPLKIHLLGIYILECLRMKLFPVFAVLGGAKRGVKTME